MVNVSCTTHTLSALCKNTSTDIRLSLSSALARVRQSGFVVTTSRRRSLAKPLLDANVNSDQSFKALKVNNAQKAEFECTDINHREYLKSKGAGEIPGKDHIVTHTDAFWLKSFVGRHLCMVMPPMQTDLKKLNAKYPGPIAMPFLKQILRDVLKSLGYMHEDLRMIHGNLQPGNILFPITDKTVLSKTLDQVQNTGITYWNFSSFSLDRFGRKTELIEHMVYDTTELAVPSDGT